MKTQGSSFVFFFFASADLLGLLSFGIGNVGGFGNEIYQNKGRWGDGNASNIHPGRVVREAGWNACRLTPVDNRPALIKQ